ncbi:MAG: MFS transporter [Betaproteobacteria bacterium]|nr:MFS transporter [Betaproteobacteria bacterium]
MSASTLVVSPRTEYGVIALVGFAHGVSHFFHLLLPPLFPWLMPEFGLNFTQAGTLMTVFFVISGTGQAAAGFLVDRIGPRRVLLGGMICFVAAALTLAGAEHYVMLLLAAALAGLGNSIFHPADFTLLNHRVTGPRLAHGFSVHGLAGNLGWAAAPALLATLAALAGWRNAALAAAAVAGIAWLVLWSQRDATLARTHHDHQHQVPAAGQSALAFLGSLPVWLCFAFFLLVTSAFGGLQNFSVPLLQNLYGFGVGAAAAGLSVFLLGGAAGIALGGAFANRAHAHDRLIAAALVATATLALLLGSAWLPAWSVTVVLGTMGFFTGVAGPSRDLLIRRAAMTRFGPAAYGRVYGFVYSGLDSGLALAPLIFGPLMDGRQYGWVWIGIAVFYALAAITALSVGRQVTAK